MPIVYAILVLIPLGMIVSSNNQEQQLNNLCVAKFSTIAEIHMCKQMLSNRYHPQLTESEKK